VQGRVINNRPIRPSAEDSKVLNFWHMVQRWLTHELADVKVRARDPGGTYETRTDAEGFFRIEMPAGGPPSDPRGWHEVELDLPDFPTPSGRPAIAKVLVPTERAQFGVISDIDDTVIFTAATNILRMARTVLLGTAFSRLPFKGVAAFYRGLAQGTASEAVNPVFYVSSSPWNLYDVLRDLFDIRSIPSGPLMLQDFGIEPGKFITASHREHKLAAIRGIMETYPHLKFILVGDSGQKDPEIYRETVDLFPERVLAVYSATSRANPSEMTRSARCLIRCVRWPAISCSPRRPLKSPSMRFPKDGSRRMCSPRFSMRRKGRSRPRRWKACCTSRLEPSKSPAWEDDPSAFPAVSLRLGKPTA
jgi:phosphatidate phosphatase APP1